jgi:class 3 adenylate cyclase
MPEENVQRKLSAIMFTDIVGYSKMMGEDEVGTLTFLKFHNALLQGEIEKNGGRVIKTVGDAFLADFGSAVNAVRCAVSIQKHLHDYNQGFSFSSGQKHQVRIGIHIGDVVMSDNDIFGEGVNIAARLQPIAEPGGICISQDVYNHIKNQVEFHATALGPHELKNIAQKIEIYKIVMEVMGGGVHTVSHSDPHPVLGVHKEPKSPSGSRLSVAWILVWFLLAALATLGGIFWFNEANKPVAYQARPGFRPLYVPSRPPTRIDANQNPGNQITAMKKHYPIFFHYDTGTSGSGVTIYPNNPPFVADKYLDAEDCDTLEIFASAPSGFQFQVALNEAGVGSPGAASYPGVNGADGEQYRSPMITGTGNWQNYQIKLADFTLSSNWGNQSGNKVLNLTAIESAQFDFPPNQGPGNFNITSVVFTKFYHSSVIPVRRVITPAANPATTQ